MDNQSRITTIVIVIIIAILMLTIGIIIGKHSNNGSTGKGNVKETEKRDNKEELKLTDNLVKDADSLIPVGMCGYQEFQFNGKDIVVDDLSSQTKVNMLVYHYGVVGDNKKITEDDAKIFFEDVSFLEDVKKGKVKEVIAPFKISYKDGFYVISSYGTGCEGPYEGYSKKLIKATKIGDELELTYAYYYMDYDYDNEYIMLYKKQGSKATYNKVEMKDDEYVQDGKKLDYSVFNYYVLKFDNSDGNLRFKSMTYVEV